MAKALSVFYDLETSDLEPIGQILNFSFIAVNADYEIVDEYSDRVALSCLQLPRAAAIAANHIDVCEHQRVAKLTETEFATKLARFLNSLASAAGDYQAQLIGFNSAKFDLGYLRTTLIRNGVNPYFRLKNKDLYLLAKKLLQQQPTFQKKMQTFWKEQKVRPGLKLEQLTQAHCLLAGAQAHESRSDVLLTIELARLFQKEYGWDVRSFEPYEGQAIHAAPRGSVFSINSSFSESKGVKRSYVTLLALDRRSALWVDLGRFQEATSQGEDPRTSVKWYKYEAQPFFLEAGPIKNEHYQALAQQALRELGEITLENFFGETDCDIEQFIYRIPFDEITALQRALPRKETPQNLSADAQELWRRYRLANTAWGKDGYPSAQKGQWPPELAAYISYRYGGRAKLSKNSNLEEAGRKEGREEKQGLRYYPSLPELFEEIEKVSASGGEEIKRLMFSLRSYYENSLVYQVARTLAQQ